MVDIVAMLGRSQDQVPTGAHSAILGNLESIHPMLQDTKMAGTGPIWITDPTTWSGRMWLRFPEEGEGHSKKTSILNLIGYMGSLTWYDAQLEACKAPLTKQKRPRKRKSSPFLDFLLQEKMSQVGEPRKRRKLALEGARSSLPIREPGNVSNASIHRRRRNMIERINGGKRLRTMVSKTGLGILLRYNTWECLKMSDDEFTKRVVGEFQTEARKETLLPTLREQVITLAQQGKTNRPHFLTSLKSQSIVSEERASRLRAKFVNAKPVLKASANTEVDALITAVSQLFDTLDSDVDNSIIARGAVNLIFRDFKQLRPD
ncbi:hypothetical protein F5X98DRAFT_381630 [Xylaria grammica]|nr:hypothetical protein F5X98DRAFT_381630 [Xylaria grammica]